MLVDAEGNIILLSEDYGSIYKYLRIARYDSAVVLGGKGSSEEAFLQATKIAAYNRQQLFVLDGVQSRLLVFNPNLKLLRSIDFLKLQQASDEITQLFPLSFSVNAFGEIFILNQFDNRIYKFNPAGSLELSFGGTDYGEGRLYAPFELHAHTDQRIYVADSMQEGIVVYDRFGLFLQRLVQPPGSWKSFRCFEQYVVYIAPGLIQLQYVPTQQVMQIPLPADSGLRDVYFTKDFIYLLLDQKVEIYQVSP